LPFHLLVTPLSAAARQELYESLRYDEDLYQ